MKAILDLRAGLLEHAPLVALVGTGVALSSVPQGQPLPFVVLSGTDEFELSLENTVLAVKHTIEAQCWADSGIQADQVAEACLAAAALKGWVVTGRVSAFDAEIGLDASVLTIESWD